MFDWQTIVAVIIALVAGTWAAKKILLPIINEFRKRKSDVVETGCGACGDEKGGLCGKAHEPKK